MDLEELSFKQYDRGCIQVCICIDMLGRHVYSSLDHRKRGGRTGRARNHKFYNRISTVIRSGDIVGQDFDSEDEEQVAGLASSSSYCCHDSLEFSTILLNISTEVYLSSKLAEGLVYMIHASLLWTKIKTKAKLQIITEHWKLSFQGREREKDMGLHAQMKKT